MPSSQILYVILDNGKIAKQTYTITDNSIIELSNLSILSDTKSKSCSVDEFGHVILISEDHEVSIIDDGTEELLGLPGGIEQVQSLSLSEQDYVLLARPKDQNKIYAFHQGDAYQLSIEPGLSIDGIENSAWISSTPASMGNTFTSGLTLIGDKESSRLVMISNEYLAREIDQFIEKNNP